MRVHRIAAVFLLMAVAAACDGTTAEPEPGPAFLRWGNAIAGGFLANATLNGEGLGEIAPGESIRETVESGAQDAGFQFGSTTLSATIHLPTERPVVVLLVDAASPRLFSVRTEVPPPDGAGLMLLNATPEGPLSIRVGDTDGSVGGQAESFAPASGRFEFANGGTFEVSVHDGNEADEVLVGSVDLVLGEWTYVTIVPGTDQRWEAMAF